MRCRQHGLWVIALLWLVACVPQRYASLSIPVESVDHRAHERALLEVRLQDLATRMEGFDATALAFYTQGRTPAAHALIDTDLDGKPDIARVQLAVGVGGTARILVVCPGPHSDATLDPWDGARAVANFEKASR